MTISWVRGAFTFGSTLLVLTSSAGLAGSKPVTERIRLWLISLVCTVWSPLRSVHPRSMLRRARGVERLGQLSAESLIEVQPRTNP